jgi:hypothetical protein
MVASLLGELVLLPALLCLRFRPDAVDADDQSDERADVLEGPAQRASHYHDPHQRMDQVA